MKNLFELPEIVTLSGIRIDPESDVLQLEEGNNDCSSGSGKSNGCGSGAGDNGNGCGSGGSEP